MRRIVSLVVLAVVVVVVVSWATLSPAQELVAYNVRVYRLGEFSQYELFSFPATEVLCNVSPYRGALPVIDPDKLEWIDPDHVGRVCVWSNFNRVRPTPGNYTVTIQSVDSNGMTSVESLPTPFIIAMIATADAPSGVKVYR